MNHCVAVIKFYLLFRVLVVDEYNSHSYYKYRDKRRTETET